MLAHVSFPILFLNHVQATPQTVAQSRVQSQAMTQTHPVTNPVSSPTHSPGRFIELLYRDVNFLIILCKPL